MSVCICQEIRTNPQREHLLILLFNETVFYSLGQTVVSQNVSSNGCLSNMSGAQIKNARNDIVTLITNTSMHSSYAT